MIYMPYHIQELLGSNVENVKSPITEFLGREKAVSSQIRTILKLPYRNLAIPTKFYTTITTTKYSLWVVQTPVQQI